MPSARQHVERIKRQRAAEQRAAEQRAAERDAKRIAAQQAKRLGYTSRHFRQLWNMGERDFS